MKGEREEATMPFGKLKDDLRALIEEVDKLKNELTDDTPEEHLYGVQRALDKASADMETAVFWVHTAVYAIIKAKKAHERKKQ